MNHVSINGVECECVVVGCIEDPPPYMGHASLKLRQAGEKVSIRPSDHPRGCALLKVYPISNGVQTSARSHNYCSRGRVCRVDLCAYVKRRLVSPERTTTTRRARRAVRRITRSNPACRAETRGGECPSNVRTCSSQSLRALATMCYCEISVECHQSSCRYWRKAKVRATSGRRHEMAPQSPHPSPSRVRCKLEEQAV